MPFWPSDNFINGCTRTSAMEHIARPTTLVARCTSRGRALPTVLRSIPQRPNSWNRPEGTRDASHPLHPTYTCHRSQPASTGVHPCGPRQTAWLRDERHYTAIPPYRQLYAPQYIRPYQLQYRTRNSTVTYELQHLRRVLRDRDGILRRARACALVYRHACACG